MKLGLSIIEKGNRARIGFKNSSPFFMTYQSRDLYGLSLPSLRKYFNELESRGFIEFSERGVKGQRHATRVRLLK